LYQEACCAAPSHHSLALVCQRQPNREWDGAQMSWFIKGIVGLRRGPWEMLATILIALGVFMLMQPFLLLAYTYSFIVTLVGTVMFLIVSHFPE
jgi:hypothetical protein